uniref:Signal recognition particle 14 kDa protein n=1 Tax=Pavo cristatus TaxID=9049 RepID=A0A8C9F3U2_PAVCR
MVLLESEQFLTELTRLFQKCRTSGSVFITLKKYDGRTKPVPRKGHVESFEPADNKCLLRATDGKKKISTVLTLGCQNVTLTLSITDRTIAQLYFLYQILLQNGIAGQAGRNCACFPQPGVLKEGGGKLLLER